MPNIAANGRAQYSRKYMQSWADKRPNRGMTDQQFEDWLNQQEVASGKDNIDRSPSGDQDD